MRITAKRMLSIITIIVSILCFSSCSKIMTAIAEDKITNLVTSVFDSYIYDRNDEVMSDLGVELKSLTKEQQDAYRYSLKNASYEIKSIDISSDCSAATVSLKFNNLVDFDEVDIPSGTVEEVHSEIKTNSNGSVLVRLKLEKNSANEWYFTNLENVVAKLRTPYSKICFIDENGTPINITEEYLKKMVVAYTWIDSIIGNPIKSDEKIVLDSPVALKPAFYLNKPVSLSFICELKNISTGDVFKQTVTIKENVFIVFDFTGDENGLPLGDYCATLYYNDMEIIKSDVITVR